MKRNPLNQTVACASHLSFILSLKITFLGQIKTCIIRLDACSCFNEQVDPSVTVSDRKFCPCDSRNEWFIGFTTAVYHYAVKASDPRLHNFRQPEPCPSSKNCSVYWPIFLSLGKKTSRSWRHPALFNRFLLKLDTTRLSEVNRHLLAASESLILDVDTNFLVFLPEQQIVR